MITIKENNENNENKTDSTVEEERNLKTYKIYISKTGKEYRITSSGNVYQYNEKEKIRKRESYIKKDKSECLKRGPKNNKEKKLVEKKLFEKCTDGLKTELVYYSKSGREYKVSKNGKLYLPYENKILLNELTKLKKW